MKAFVTGASGFIGGHLVAVLSSAGHDVHVLLRPNSREGALAGRATIHRGDGDAVRLTSLLAEIQPDIVFHLASRFQDRHEPGDIAGIVQSNVTFGAALADAMVRAGCKRLVNTGTSWQHLENGADRPVCLYAATKTAFESILRYFVDAHGLNVITLKLFDTYGPNDQRGKLLSTFRRIAASGEGLSMSPGAQKIDLVHVRDVVSCFMQAGKRLMNGQAKGLEDYAVSSGAPMALRDLAELFGRVSGTPLRIEWGGRPYRDREVMTPWNTGAALPGWSPTVELEQGLAELLG